MSNTFTLDALRTETANRYAPTKIILSDESTVELKSVLKLKKAAREEVLEIVGDFRKALESADDDDDEMVELWSAEVCDVATKIIKLICTSPKKLVDELEHDDPEIKANLFISVLTRWIARSQLGEAGSSPS